MDKGTHFHKCDFQVHTPRDANWKGIGAVTPEERHRYASELILACREKGIDAIAITDHHDFAFFPYVKRAAENEIDPQGNSRSKDSQIVVFPGLELTLSSPPCQAILVLDQDFDESKLGDILTTLAIEATDEGSASLKNLELVSPTTVASLNDLEDKLNQRSWLRGRFILLPNVTDGGHKNLLREGFHEHYKEMRCVGGYIDGNYESRTSEGKKNILEGRQQNNGYKPLAIFQTSDNRNRNHSELGKHTTYVKWSEPTAEALRQACLAKESRLSLSEPELPNLWVTSLTVSNSKFLGRVNLDLNQQYNAIIGGRGTGKSTILEYLRWGLCDQPVEVEDAGFVQNKRKALIDNTLQKFDGEVCVEFVLNGVLHIVKRNAKNNEIRLKIGDGSFVDATEHQVRALLPIQAYSQKQLSNVGVRIDELRRFVTLPIKPELDEIKSNTRAIEAKIRSAYGNLIRVKEIRSEIEKNQTEIASLTEQVSKLRKSLKGLSKSDEAIIDQKALYDEEESIIDELRNSLATAQNDIESISDVLTGDEEMDELPEIVNVTALTEIRKAYSDKFDAIRAGIQSLLDLFDDDSVAAISASEDHWIKLREAFEKRYEAAKKKARANQQQLESIQALEKRIATLKRQQTEKGNALASIGTPEIDYKEHRGEWIELHKKKLSALDRQCDDFSVLSNDSIKAEIKGSFDLEGFVRKLKTAFSGMNIKEEKLEKIGKAVQKASDPFAEWNAVLSELELLALHTIEGSSELPDTPKLNKCSLIETERQRIGSQFDSIRWLDLSLSELEFYPSFRYCTNKKKEEFIDFADASAGQQATALLTVLLNQTGAPLLIDQPEDDVDSKMVKEIVELVWKAKTKRQLIFASHSANFVVNGDAELVVCCDYIKAGDQTHGTVKMTGAIDNAEIKNEITLVTEGGKQAFQLRMSKYGF